MIERELSGEKALPQARTLPEPRFTYTEYLREVETRTGPQERSFGLTQSIPWFGKLSLRGSIEEEAARASWQRFLAAQLALDHELRTAYADYYYLGRSISITRENLELLSCRSAVSSGLFSSMKRRTSSTSGGGLTAGSSPGQGISASRAPGSTARRREARSHSGALRHRE